MKINENRESGADQFSKDYNMEQLRDKLQTVMDTGDGSTLTTPKHFRKYFYFVVTVI